MKWDLDDEELEVLKLVAEGLTNYQISKKRPITEPQVTKHVMSILSKMGVDDRTQAAVKAVQEGCVKSTISVDFSGCTPRQQEVADCLARRITSDKAISRELGISERTVSSHVYGLQKRLGTSSRTYIAVAYLNQMPKSQ